VRVCVCVWPHRNESVLNHKLIHCPYIDTYNKMGPKIKRPAINKKANSADNVHRDAKGKGNMRSKSTIMRLNMYRRGAQVRNALGQIVGGTLLMDNKSGGKDMGDVARIAPDRRWFGNTRLISQNDLDKFRENMTVKAADPYSVVLRRQKIPMSLLKDSQKVAHMNLLETEKFDDCFGGKQVRKRPKLSNAIGDYEALMKSVTEKAVKYDADPTKDSNIEKEVSGELDIKKDDLFAKGQSKRVWGELYKVLDCSDVVLQIVDARDVPGTRCAHIENHIKKNASHKHLVIVINKCDLVPSWVTRKWVKLLSAEFPTLAFHASVTNSFGKGALISLLRQFGKLHSDKRQISVGVIGYPNCGKSSVINSLMGKKCCKAAPIPGETKVWQYIALMKRIFLIDSPGVVYDVGDDEVSVLNIAVCACVRACVYWQTIAMTTQINSAL
jgi:nuclear GTP-binding protein